MAGEFSLRVYSYLDRMQPQYAAFVGTITQGDLPTEGMASLYVEVAPGNEVFRLVDIAVKSTEARPGAQIVEREFGMFEIHSRSQSEVLEAGRIVLDRLSLKPEERIKPSKLLDVSVVRGLLGSLREPTYNRFLPCAAGFDAQPLLLPQRRFQPVVILLGFRSVLSPQYCAVLFFRCG